MIFDIVTHQNKNGVFDNITIINQETGEVVDLAYFLSLNGQVFVNNLNYAFMLIVKMCIKCGFKNTLDAKLKNEFSFIYRNGECYNIKINNGKILYIINFEKKFLQPFSDFETNKTLVDYSISKHRQSLSVGVDAFNEFIQGTYTTKKQQISLMACKTIFRRDYPIIEDSMLERAKEYVSGYQYAKQGHFHNCYNYDIASSFPSQLLNDTPIGELKEYTTLEDVPTSYFYIVKISAFDVKIKPNKIDFLDIDGKNYTIIVLTKHLYNLFLKNYDYSKIIFKRVIAFKTIRNRFDNFVTQNAILGKEQETNKAIKKYNKAIANAIVGYFGKKVMKETTTINIDARGHYNIETNVEKSDPVYLPLYLFVNGKAKAEFIDTLQKIGTQSVIYANTDGFITTQQMSANRLNFGRISSIGYYKEKTPLKEIYIETINGYTSIDADGVIDNTLSGMTITDTITIEQHQTHNYKYIVHEMNQHGDICEKYIQR